MCGTARPTLAASAETQAAGDGAAVSDMFHLANDRGDESSAPATRVEFDIYHYNGLEGGGAGSGRRARMVRGTVTNVIESSIGNFVPIDPGHGRSAAGPPITDVLITKWRNASVDWHGEDPPSID